MVDELSLRPGAYVLSVDGQSLGRIARLDGDTVEVLDGDRGFSLPRDQVLSVLQNAIFLRERLRDYLPRYERRSGTAPKLPKRSRRFTLFRRADAHW